MPSDRRDAQDHPMTLADLPRRERRRVLAVHGDDALAQRLADQGLWPGVVVEVVTTALGGDPLLVRLQGFRLALRRDEARRVQLAGPEVA